MNKLHKEDQFILITHNIISYCFLLILCILIQPVYSQSPDFSKVPGIVVNHSPQSSGLYIGSPSICILQNGNYIVSHDLFGPKSNFNICPKTLIFCSKDKGKTWENIAIINGQSWSNLFVIMKTIFIMGTDKQNGNVVIRKSIDNGYTWTNPTDEKNGLLIQGEYHTAPTPIINYGGRIWRAMETTKSETKEWGKCFSAFIMSIAENEDMMNSENWKITNKLSYDSTYIAGKFGGWLEGNVVVDPKGNILDVIRVENLNNDAEDIAAIIRIDHENKATFDSKSDFIKMPGGSKKFTIRYDLKSKLYWTVSNYIPPKYKVKTKAGGIRNTQALCCSKDLINWKVKANILSDPEIWKHTFSYVDWQFDGKDIIFVSRTAFDDGLEGAHSWHDTNFITFHRIKDFRRLKE